MCMYVWCITARNVVNGDVAAQISIPTIYNSKKDAAVKGIDTLIHNIHTYIHTLHTYNCC